ncbi:MAG: hypothetical protein EXS36_10350 [Pedosphaera sp.]|nr:hypothetical protein [Pedosphaera sp.]
MASFYLYEGHPLLWAIDDDQPTPNNLHIAYDYWGGKTITVPVKGSYADPTADVDAKVQHG